MKTNEVEASKFYGVTLSNTLKKLCIKADELKEDRNEFIKSYLKMVNLAVNITDFKKYKWEKNNNDN